MTKASKFATAIAAIASPAIATVEESSAAPLTVGATVMAPRRPKCSIGHISTMTINQFRKSSKKSGLFAYLLKRQLATKAPRPLASDPKRWLSAKN